MGTLWSLEPLGGMLLRYEICVVLMNAEKDLTVHELTERIERDGFTLAGRGGKTVADAIRWEVGKQRVRKVGRGLYRPGYIADTTEKRMRTRIDWAKVAVLVVRRMSLEGGVELEEALAVVGASRRFCALAAQGE